MSLTSLSTQHTKNTFYFVAVLHITYFLESLHGLRWLYQCQPPCLIIARRDRGRRYKAKGDSLLPLLQLTGVCLSVYLPTYCLPQN